MSVRTIDLEALNWASEPYGKTEETNFDYLVRKCLALRVSRVHIKRDQVPGIAMPHHYWAVLWRLMVCYEKRLRNCFGYLWIPAIDSEQGWKEIRELFQVYFPDKELVLYHWHPTPEKRHQEYLKNNKGARA